MIHIVVPMAGGGKRFAERGYTFPKPLIEIADKPMIEIVIHNLVPAEPHQFVFVCRQDQIQRFALGDVLSLVAPGSRTVVMNGPTSGALCSVLLAMEYLQNEDELLIANADQYVDIGVDSFLAAARKAECDGSIMTFPSTHPKWSFVKMEADQVVAVAEKHPISRMATVGLYYFRRSRDFLDAAERMLLKNATVDGEYYVAPVYNELILTGKRISAFHISREQMHGLGTPEDVEAFAHSMGQSLNW